MPLSKKIIKQISSKSPDSNKLILDGKEDSSIHDEDIVFLLKKLPQDSPIDTIHIRHHNLTVKSHRHLLDLVREHPNIISFHCDLIKPLTLANAIFNKAIKNVLVERRKIFVNGIISEVSKNLSV